MDSQEEKVGRETLQQLDDWGQRVGEIAHDLNNILTVINSYSVLLLKDINSDNPSYSDVIEIKDACDRAAILTQALLTNGKQTELR